MKSTFTAKYLQHLNKKNGNKGFTLIELLVVIIIVGVLAAIALPSFLSQIGKARGSEAKSAMGVVNRSQQAYRLENNSFAPGSTYLDAKLSPKFYTYSSASTGQNAALSTATPVTGNTDLKSYAAGIAQGTNDTIQMSICESISASGATGYAAAAASATGGAAPAAGCGTGRLLE
jgi:type IV pilus assembly protein PilA